MRRTIATMLSTLTVLTAVVVTAQPALADDPSASHWAYYRTDSALVGCDTPYRTGVAGQYGAWGMYMDGCTSARVFCPYTARECVATGEGWISTRTWVGHRVTLNSRLRLFGPGSKAPIWWEDKSCAGINACYPTPGISFRMFGGQEVTQQCNGVRQYGNNTGSVMCHVSVRYLW